MNFLSWFSSSEQKTPTSLRDFWEARRIDEEGLVFADKRSAFMLELEGLDASFFSPEQLERMHNEWRSVLQLSPGEEIQIIYRKRVQFAQWIEKQLSQALLTESPYGRRILLERLNEQVREMGQDEPRLLSQKILLWFWTNEPLDADALREKRQLFRSQVAAFGFPVRILDRQAIDREVNICVQDLAGCEVTEPEWPSLSIEAGQIRVNQDRFRALELSKLPENFTELGMIQTLISQPYPLDFSLRLRARDIRPVISRLERKRNVLSSQKATKSSPSPELGEQVKQIDQVLQSLAARSESIFDLKMTVGLRFPMELSSFQRKALANLTRAAARMDFCEMEETTLGCFDSFLECLPGFTGKNIKSHTVLGSNAIHFLPFFRPSRGDQRAIASFQTRGASLYGIDPVDPSLANYNWLVSGTSGAGKSFFVNSLIAQSTSMKPNIFIVDIGGSYNKLTQFLGGRVMSLEPGQGFELSPFFLKKSSDPKEERLRRQHIYQIFLEMTRVDGNLPALEVRHLLGEILEPLFESETLPEKPISALLNYLSHETSSEARRLSLLLQSWGGDGFFAQFLDNSKSFSADERILTFDLKGLTEFEDLSRVVQLIVCAGLWARIREIEAREFSWIVLDEVAFSLLRTQPQFVDELVSTLRKYYAGAIVVVQDLEKVTSNPAGASILQNTQSKAILQQRGDPRHFSEALSLSSLDEWAISSLQRKKGAYSEIFLIRDHDRCIIRHEPSELEYWLSTSAPEDNSRLRSELEGGTQDYSEKILNFVTRRGKTP